MTALRRTSCFDRPRSSSGRIGFVWRTCWRAAETPPRRRRLLEPAWASVKVEGRRATLPEATPRDFYFLSRVRPTAWLLSATLAVDPAHPLVGPLVETLIQQGRGERWIWNTQDYGTAISALAEFQRAATAAAAKGVRVRAAGRPVLQLASLGAARDSSFGACRPGGIGPARAQRLRLDARAPVRGRSSTTSPSRPPRASRRCDPATRGFRSSAGTRATAPASRSTEIAEGELVRVRLRVTVPSERHFVVLDDALPAGLEAVDLSLRTVGGIPGPGAADTATSEGDDAAGRRGALGLRELGCRLVVAVRSPGAARRPRGLRRDALCGGAATRATYLARATTPGRFVRPPAHAEEMYNPAVFGESDGGVFTVVQKTGAQVRSEARREPRAGAVLVALVGAFCAVADGTVAGRVCSTRERTPGSCCSTATAASCARPAPRTAAGGGGCRWPRSIPTCSRRFSRRRIAASIVTAGSIRAPSPAPPGPTCARARSSPAARPSRCSSPACSAPRPGTGRQGPQASGRSGWSGISTSRRSWSSTSTACRWGRAQPASRPRRCCTSATSAAELSLGQAALLAGLAQGAVQRQSAGLAPTRRAPTGPARFPAWWRSGYATQRGGGSRRDGAGARGGRPSAVPRAALHHAGWCGGVNGTVHPRPEPGARRSISACRRSWRARCGTPSSCSPRAGDAMPRRWCWTTRAGKSSPGSARPNFWADTAGQVDMVVSPRQPGSALKPFLYALAFDRGYTPATILPDIARVYQTSTGPYAPRNYDRRFHGPVRAREALGSSYNVPAVELAERLGARACSRCSTAPGSPRSSRSAEHYGLGLALGNGDVTLLELANGYRALANGGLWRPYRWRSLSPGEAVEPGVRITGAAVGGARARHPRRSGGAHSGLRARDAVRLSLSRRRQDRDQPALHRQLGGGDDGRIHRGRLGRQLQRASDGRRERGERRRSAAAPGRARYRATLRPRRCCRRRRRAGAVPVAICRLSGLAATPRCPSAVEWFPPGSRARVRLRLASRWRRRPAGGVRRLVGAQLGSERPGFDGAGPRRHRATMRTAVFQLVSPLDGDVYRVPPGAERRFATVALRAAGGSGDGGVRWYVDGRRYGRSRWGLERGVHRIRAVSGGGESAEATVTVE